MIEGNYPRFNSYATGNPIDYDSCPDDRFQPWPVKSYEISECISIKSTCSDRKCQCDYKAGYAMNGGVCCSPSELPDCFCYKKICGINMELDEGYNCIEKCSILDANGRCSNHSIAHEKYVEMHDVDYDQRSALHLAACECKVEAVKYLLDHHFCSPGATDRWNRTASEDAEWHKTYDEKEMDYIGVIKLLAQYKQRKPKRNISEKKCATEIIHAAKNGEIHTLRRLQEQGVDMDLSNSAGRTALHAAAVNGIEKVVDFLIDECKVSPFVRWMQKRPIDYVPDNDNQVNQRIREKLRVYMDKLLIDASVSEELPPDNQTQIVRLLNCASRGNIQRMKSLHSKKVNMNLRDYDGRTALHLAAAESQIEAVEFLVNEANENRRPFNEATNEDIKSLLQASDTEHTNATYNEVNFHTFRWIVAIILKKHTFTCCCIKAKLKDVKYLLNERKVSPFVRNSFWKTPVQLVEEKCYIGRKGE
ncbi:unnamed protein product [Mytilus edulis]|uniref:Uncharacterized protein n=1 Tax=Mytilus edulis TaxID=6550 RepID=A0A8S3R034_MYTED|nr:unnamed protein product [Mytilus edulis]